ncbi:MAG TPA: hypothetical protein VFE63_09980 [Roseiarcus sp.]|jgi:hypothetical protein|nr:hypothetical protein [Roseiarcus sp.]
MNDVARELDIAWAQHRQQTDRRTLDRQIDAAWRERELQQAKVPPEARRAAQAFIEAIRADAARVRRVYESTPFRKLLIDWARKPGVGRDRALRAIRLMISPALVDDRGGGLTIVWLEAHNRLVEGVDHPSFD